MTYKTWTPPRSLSRIRAITARERLVAEEISKRSSEAMQYIRKLTTSLQRFSAITIKLARAKAYSFFL